MAKFNKLNLKSPTMISQIQDWDIIIDTLKTELEKEYLYVAKSSLLQLKMKWIIEGEKNTKYFLNFERSKVKKKTMTKVKTLSGVLKDLKVILAEQSKYFKKLYQSNPEICFELQSDLGIEISELQKQEIKSEITKEEISKNLKSFRQQKSPGPDGIPVDFYIMFWPKLQDYPEILMKCIVNTRNLHKSARRGIISLIPKKGCDLLYIKNWRPIILLNADYKLFSKILVTRLRNILDTIIHKDQMGFMPGRNISHNLWKTLDTITYIQKRKIDAILILLDFEKAFDRLEYKSLYGTLRAFGIQQEYIDNIEILFTDFKLATVNGGFFSDWFSPSRGVFQGNCISPYTLITVIEILAIRLRQNDNIKGIEINGLINLLTQFADNMQMFMKFLQKSLQATIDELTIFEGISGMKVNYDKTAIYHIGSLTNSNAKLYVSREFQWMTEPLVILGLEVSNAENQMYDNNYSELIKKAENVLHCW